METVDKLTGAVASIRDLAQKATHNPEGLLAKIAQVCDFVLEEVGRPDAAARIEFDGECKRLHPPTLLAVGSLAVVEEAGGRTVYVAGQPIVARGVEVDFDLERGETEATVRYYPEREAAGGSGEAQGVD